MARYLLIVARTQPDLYDYLTQEFSEDKEVEVLLDRRREERRQRGQAHEPDRRRVVRRGQPRISGGLQTLGVMVARPQQEAPSG